MTSNIASSVRLQARVARQVLMWGTVLSCCACTSLPNFLRPPQPRATVSAVVQVPRGGIEHGRSSMRLAKSAG